MNPSAGRSADKPLLLLDIDGVISLFGFDALAPPPGRMRLVDGLPHYLSTEAAGLVTDLAQEFALVWCSGWEDRADEHLPAALGVPAGLPHLAFGPPRAAPVRHWKLDAIDAYAGRERPLAWVDDAFDAGCHTWAADRPAPTLLVTTDPAEGLVAAHARGLRRWAHELPASPRAERPVAPGPAAEPLDADLDVAQRLPPVT